MDSTTHYLTYDPDAIFEKMTEAYIDAGGDPLYPGDEKEMILRAVQSVIVQSFAGIDNALRMSTLRYAVGDYLDIVGENRGCERIKATAAVAMVEISFKRSLSDGIIPQGTELTADGVNIYYLQDDVNRSGYEETVHAYIVANNTGIAGNGLDAGQQMQFMTAQEAIDSIFVIESASGGKDEETDDDYRERIGKHMLTSVTTGPASQYESVARSVSSSIKDAKAFNAGAGSVNVYLIVDDGDDANKIVNDVTGALNDRSVRPLTDSVSVYIAPVKSYSLVVQYSADVSSDIADNLSSIANEYKNWQDNTIGQAFNPDKLMAMMYSAGATRVIWGGSSRFDGANDIKYTEISRYERCKGAIRFEVIS